MSSADCAVSQIRACTASILVVPQNNLMLQFVQDTWINCKYLPTQHINYSVTVNNNVQEHMILFTMKINSRNIRVSYNNITMYTADIHLSDTMRGISTLPVKM